MSSVTSRRLARTGGRACVRIAKNCDLPAHSQIAKNRLRRNQPVGGPSSRENGWHCVSYTLCRDVYLDETYFDIQKWFRLVSDFCLTFVKNQTEVRQKSDKSQTKVRFSCFCHVDWVQSGGATLLIATHVVYGTIRRSNPPIAIRWGNPHVFAIGWVWSAYDELDLFDQLQTTSNIIRRISV